MVDKLSVQQGFLYQGLKTIQQDNHYILLTPFSVRRFLTGTESIAQRMAGVNMILEHTKYSYSQ